MLKIHIQKRHKKDLEEIWQYSFEEWGEKQADKFYERFKEQINHRQVKATERLLAKAVWEKALVIF
jgi:plasmid stabilization system protein ParE